MHNHSILFVSHIYFEKTKKNVYYLPSKLGDIRIDTTCIYRLLLSRMKVTKMH